MSGLAVDALLVAVSWIHVVLAPYTKVEESFNLHAAHDVLMYGVSPESLRNYDHNVFPGAVPRTFVASVLLSWAAAPFIRASIALGMITTKFDLQIALRLVLASLNAFTLILVRRAVSARFGRQTSWWYALLTCSQFHLPFWMGRTLPNMFALAPVNVAYYLLYNRAPTSRRALRTRINVAIALLTFTAVVFRSEVALLLAPLALQLVVGGHATLLDLAKVGLLSGLASIAITVVVDSYFWNQWPLWPELYGLYFNVYLGKSAEWGTSPAHAYFTAYLPKLLLGSVPMAVLGAALDRRIRSMLVAPVAFVLVLSLLGHKEWRFVVYVVPVANIAAARGARWMTSRKNGFMFKRLFSLCALALVCLNLIATLVSTRASMENYPGGAAIAAFNERYAGRENVDVHVSNLAAQTGASLFLHERAPPSLDRIFGSGLAFASRAAREPTTTTSWTYNKTEWMTPGEIASSSFTHLIAEPHEIAVGGEGGEWTIVEVVRGFERWRVVNDAEAEAEAGVSKRRAWEVPFGRWAGVVEMEMRDRLWILERDVPVG